MPTTEPEEEVDPKERPWWFERFYFTAASDDDVLAAWHKRLKEWRSLCNPRATSST